MNQYENPLWPDNSRKDNLPLNNPERKENNSKNCPLENGTNSPRYSWSKNRAYYFE